MAKFLTDYKTYRIIKTNRNTGNEDTLKDKTPAELEKYLFMLGGSELVHQVRWRIPATYCFDYGNYEIKVLTIN